MADAGRQAGRHCQAGREGGMEPVIKGERRKGQGREGGRDGPDGGRHGGSDQGREEEGREWRRDGGGRH